MEGLELLFKRARTHLDERQAKRLDKTKIYIFANKDGLKKELSERGLGTIEGQIDKILANRPKKRGMSWKIDGAHRMANMLCIRENGELLKRLENCHVSASSPPTVSLNSISLPEDPGSWMQAHLPALTWPHSKRPWVDVLREVAGLRAFA
ncbi:MAG: hypothetical protein AB1743_08635 [Actinomycetota bacterium]